MTRTAPCNPFRSRHSVRENWAEEQTRALSGQLSWRTGLRGLESDASLALDHCCSLATVRMTGHLEVSNHFMQCFAQGRCCAFVLVPRMGWVAAYFEVLFNDKDLFPLLCNQLTCQPDSGLLNPHTLLSSKLKMSLC